jgi:hypothetical protein
MALYYEIDPGLRAPSSPELKWPQRPPGVIIDSSLEQARDLGVISGIKITPKEAILYKALRERPMDPDRKEPLKSDQVLMASVLEQTGGPVDLFKAAFPNIFPQPQVNKES